MKHSKECESALLHGQRKAFFNVRCCFHCLNCLSVLSELSALSVSSVLSALTVFSVLSVLLKITHLFSSVTACGRGEYFSKNQYFFTNPQNSPARDSRDTLSLDSNISARTPKKAIFLHVIEIFLLGSLKMHFFMHN